MLFQPISRKRYWFWLILLFSVKFAVDVGICAKFGGRVPYFHSMAWTAGLLWLVIPGLSCGTEQAFSVLRMVFSSLALLAGWILAFRRSITVGSSRAATVISLFPVVGPLQLILLGFFDRARSLDPEVNAESKKSLVNLSKSFLMTAIYAIAVSLLLIYGFKSYGLPLFFLGPVFTGICSGYFGSQSGKYFGRAIGEACLLILVIGALMLIFAMEGVICLAMAAPLALFGAILGATLGRHAAKFAKKSATYAVIGLGALLPGYGALDAQRQDLPPLRTVTTAVEVNAPPEKVWEYVVDLPEIPRPQEWEFRAGISYPISVRADSHAVGALRTCVFNTGEVLERITVLEPAKQLTFEILSQPHLMTELSPYEHVHAPHLEGGVKSERGEFRLYALPGGRTRIEGQSWYRSEFEPDGYWGIYSDRVVKLVHRRVLGHIRMLAELK